MNFGSGRSHARLYRRGCIGNQGAKPEHGHMVCSVVERHPFRPKIGRVYHDDASLVAGIQQHARRRGVSSTARGGTALFILPNRARPRGSAHFNS